MSNAEQIKKLEEEIAKLKKQDADFAALIPEHQVANTLHKMLCHHNHTDGCSWEYECWEGTDKSIDWNGHAHSRYLTKARNVLDFCKWNKVAPEKAIGLLETVLK